MMHTVSRRLPIALFALGTFAPDEGTVPLTVLAGVRSAFYYVGQSVDLSIGVVAGLQRPLICMPNVPGADVTFVGTDIKPLSTSAIGDAVFETNLYRTRYRLIPRRPGTLKIPAVPAVLGERRGVSEPIILTIWSPPVSGRPAEFLGGIGSFEVQAQAEPTSVESGQSIHYRVTVRGPGSRGITGSPELTRIDRLSIGMNVERFPDQAVTDPPSRTFVYRVRPTRAGRFTLPPVGISSFDPKSRRYLTKVTPGITVRVTDVPKFDPAAVQYAPHAADRPAANLRLRLWPKTVRALTVIVSSTAAGLTVMLLRKRRSSRRRGVKRVARDTLNRLTLARSDHERGRILTEGLVAYLSLTIGRPSGVITPGEAEEGVALATRSVDLATRAAALIARCDEVQYDVETSAPGDRQPILPDEVSRLGRTLFGDLTQCAS